VSSIISLAKIYGFTNTNRLLVFLIEKELNMRHLAVVLASLTGFSMVVTIVDTEPFVGPGFETVQHTLPCPKGQVWSQSDHACLPKR
jgi:hypothetical protein